MKKLVLMLVCSIFIVGCSGVISNKEKINVSELNEKGQVEIAGNIFEASHPSIVSYKYDGSNVVERLDNNAKILSFYNGNILYKHEGYSTGSGRLLWTYLYTYDDEGKEIRKETIIEQTKDRMNQLTSYGNNYKEISYYDKNDELLRVSEFELNNAQQIIKGVYKLDDGSTTGESYYKYNGDKKVFIQLINENSIAMETYYEYNDYGDLVYQIMINFGEVNTLRAMYFVNEYDENKLVQQKKYNFQGELNEKQVSDIVKSLK